MSAFEPSIATMWIAVITMLALIIWISVSPSIFSGKRKKSVSNLKVLYFERPGRSDEKVNSVEKLSNGKMKFYLADGTVEACYDEEIKRRYDITGNSRVESISRFTQIEQGSERGIPDPRFTTRRAELGSDLNRRFNATAWGESQYQRQQARRFREDGTIFEERFVNRHARLTGAGTPTATQVERVEAPKRP